MKETNIRSIATILIAAFIIIGMSLFKIDVNEAKDFEWITTDSIILKLNTNKVIVNGAVKMVDSENPRTMPYIDENSRTLVPARCVSENLGANVSWDAENKVVTITKGSDVISFTIGSRYIDKNGIKSEMDTSAIIYEERTYIPLRALVEVGLNKEIYWEPNEKIIVISKDNEYVEKNLKGEVLEEVLRKLDSLSVVGNYDIFKKLMENSRTDIKSVNAFDLMTDNAAAESVKQSESNSDYSKTNTQVENVDEADIVKTDGKYVYYLTENKLVIADTSNNTLKIVKEVEYNQDGELVFIPQEMYINGNTLVVVGREETRRQVPIARPNIEIDYAVSDIAIMPYYRFSEMAKAICYDISNPANLMEKRTVKADGYYVDSRMVKDNVYLITRKYNDVYVNDLENVNEDDFKPEYFDSTISNENIKIQFSDICYFPDVEESSYTLITSFDASGLMNAKVNTFLGMGENIYMSENTLYVAKSNYSYNYNYDAGSSSRETEIYKFKVKNNEVEYQAKAKVDGTIINQFAMDDNGQNFRIATTTSNSIWDNRHWKEERYNNLFILDNKMKVVGQLTNIAPDEDIYSVRFMGNRVYLVTYEQIDPLFVIDVENPTNPKILGELKIEGYSSYLHPYDENHILGIGVDTKRTSSGVTTQGMKMAMFDVTDPTNPVAMFTEVIGEEGTYSELLYNHKALLFSKEKNLLAFPISIYTKENKKYTTLKENGAIVYSIDLDKGFTRRGLITHAKDIKDVETSYFRNLNSSVSRVIFIGNNLYTFTRNEIKSSNMETLEENAKITIELKNTGYEYLYKAYID